MSITITLNQARQLVAFFNREDAEVIVSQGLDNQPAGLYAWLADHPEEGSMYLGPTETAETVGSAESASFNGFLCRAWGETDKPCAEVVSDLAGVSRFMVREWLGSEDATDADGTPTLPRVMAEITNRDWAEEGDWEAQFEIGGVSVELVYSFTPLASSGAAPIYIWKDGYDVGRKGGINAPFLDPNTAMLVLRFSDALREKLAAAERKYGYSDGWMDTGWLDECRRQLVDHVDKGDPLDVAAYCAFLWHHQASTYSRAWNAMSTAPRDGSIIRLLVEFEEHQLEDHEAPQHTIGSNSFDNTGVDQWQFVGWCWTHDHYTEGKGTVVGWLPFSPTAL